MMMDRGESTRNDGTSISLQMGEAIVVRLSQLERELRASRRTSAFLSIGLVAATVLAIGALGTAVLFRGRVSALETRQIVLKDENNVDRAMLHVTTEGAAALHINDRNGVGRLRFSVLENGAPGVALTDGRGRSRAVLGFLPEQGGTLVFADEQGNTRAVLGLTGAQGASLAFLDGLGATRASFGIDESGEPAWSLNERDAPPVTPPAAPDTTGSSN